MIYKHKNGYKIVEIKVVKNIKKLEIGRPVDSRCQ